MLLLAKPGKRILALAVLGLLLGVQAGLALHQAEHLACTGSHEAADGHCVLCQTGAHFLALAAPQIHELSCFSVEFHSFENDSSAAGSLLSPSCSRSPPVLVV